MRKILLSLTVIALAVPVFADHFNKVVKVGDKAPDFTLLSDEWKTVKLSDYHGKKNVFLAVYVLAFTGG